MCRYIILLGLLISASISSCGLDCLDKKTGMHKSSQTIDESKENKVFKFEMFTKKKEFELSPTKRFRINTAWVEDGWLYDCINNRAVLKKDEFKQLVIDGKYSYQSDSLNYVLMEDNNRRGVFLGSMLAFQYDGRDTFLLTLQENSSGKIIDTLKFFKGVSTTNK